MPYGIADRVAVNDSRQIRRDQNVGSALNALCGDGVQPFRAPGGDAAAQVDQTARTTAACPQAPVPPIQ